MVSAGECSGDLRAAECIQLWTVLGDVSFFGMGGPAMRLAGCDIHIPIDEHSSFGFFEVIICLPRLYVKLFKLKSLLKTHQPDCLVCVDFQAFNLKLARAAKSMGIPVLFYVGPQIWASRPHRAKKYANVIDHLAVLFPFEPPLYKRLPVKVSYVGHPLVSAIQKIPHMAVARNYFQFKNNATYLGLFPGSRASEIKRLLPVMLDTVNLLQNHTSNLYIVLSLAEHFPDDYLRPYLADFPNIKVIKGQSQMLMQACDVLLISSGTATLEAGLLNKPMVVTYRLNTLSEWLSKKLLITPYVALPNVLLNRCVVPELIGKKCHPLALKNALMPLLTSGKTRQDMVRELSQLNMILGQESKPTSMVNVLKEVLNQNRD